MVFHPNLKSSSSTFTFSMMEGKVFPKLETHQFIFNNFDFNGEMSHLFTPPFRSLFIPTEKYTSLYKNQKRHYVLKH